MFRKSPNSNEHLDRSFAFMAMKEEPPNQKEKSPQRENKWQTQNPT
jgi:hypothetical protein